MIRQRQRNGLVWCLAIGWCFVAPKMAWGEARRGSISAAICDRGATKPQAIFGATLRAAGLFASRGVARSLQTANGYARRSRLAGGENPWRRNTSQLRDTTLAVLLRRVDRQSEAATALWIRMGDSRWEMGVRVALPSSIFHLPAQRSKAGSRFACPRTPKWRAPRPNVA